MRCVVPALLALLAPAFACCGPQTLGHAIEVDAYEQEQIQCVNLAHTLAESKACREQVRTKYNLLWQRDGGPDAGRD